MDNSLLVSNLSTHPPWLIATLTQIFTSRSNPIYLSTTVNQAPISSQTLLQESVEIFIELKWCSGDDPFGDVQWVIDGKTVSVPSFLHETKSADDTLGQITTYAAAHLGSQFRTHVYSILIVKGTARILRWDRTGTIVTEAIQYTCRVFPSLLAGIACHAWYGPVGVRPNTSKSEGGQKITGAG